MTVHSSALRALLFALPVTLLAGQAQAPPPKPPAPRTPQTPPAGQAPPSVFRGGTVLVPVDVRVLDRSGNPVTDLRQDEFVIVENGVRQQIRHFSTQSLVASAPSSGAPPRMTSRFNDVAPETHRTFLIVLGRGRLQPVTKALDGMVHLVRERLLPQDYVAVMAYNRATDFTTDHEKVAAVIERFMKQGDKIEQAMATQYSGLAAAYGSAMPISKPVQALIDQVFTDPKAGAVRTVADAPVANASRVSGDQRLISDTLMTGDINNATGSSMAGPTNGLGGPDMTFDDYVSTSAQSMQDLSKIYSGISYLRYLEGDKHLIFVSERGLFLPRSEDDRSLAAVASDARVVIDILHTGGTAGPGATGGFTPPGGNTTGGAGGGGGAGAGRGIQVAARPGAAGGGTGQNGRGGARGTGPGVGDWRISTSRTVAQQTGGYFTSLEMGKAYADHLDTATRFSYVLGYYPVNGTLDGKYRNVTVRVTRPGLTVEYRHGYFATADVAPLDRARVLTYTRVVSAANSDQPIPDIGMTVTAANVVGDDGSPFVDVTVQIRPERLGFADKDGRKKGAIEVAIFCADEKEHLLGESWNTVDLEMTPDAFAKFQTTGAIYAGKVPVRGAVRFVKIIVYDSTSDTLGSSLTKLDPPKIKK